MFNFEPERVQEALMAIPGAMLYGLYHLAGLIAAGQSPTLGDYIRALINIVFAVASGMILAYFLTNPLVAWIPTPFAALRDRSAIAFIIGAGGWELLPLIVNGVRGWVAKLAGRAGQ